VYMAAKANYACVARPFCGGSIRVDRPFTVRNANDNAAFVG